MEKKLQYYVPFQSSARRVVTMIASSATRGFPWVCCDGKPTDCLGYLCDEFKVHCCCCNAWEAATLPQPLFLSCMDPITEAPPPSPSMQRAHNQVNFFFFDASYIVFFILLLLNFKVNHCGTHGTLLCTRVTQYVGRVDDP